MTASARPWFAIALLLSLLGGCGRREAVTQEHSTEGSEEAGEKEAGDSNRVVLQPGAAERAGIAVQRAGGGTIDVTVQVPGEVKADSGRVLVIRPRFAGIVRSMRKQIGDPVRRGETVATIQSNESLTDYAVTSAMPGRVVARGASPGTGVTQETSLYTIVDLSQVWVEFAIYPHQIGTIRRGQTVRIAPQGAVGPVATATIAYVGPLLAEDTRVSIGRVIVPNQGGRWDPGLFVSVTVVTDHAQVRVAVPDEAILRMQEGSAVFLAQGGGYQLRRVVTGRSDGRFTEITSGVAPGDPVVVHNAFVLKAELEKSEYEE